MCPVHKSLSKSPNCSVSLVLKSAAFKRDVDALNHLKDPFPFRLNKVGLSRVKYVNLKTFVFLRCYENCAIYF